MVIVESGDNASAGLLPGSHSSLSSADSGFDGVGNEGIAIGAAPLNSDGQPPSMCSFAYFQRFFDVNTSQVTTRLLRYQTLFSLLLLLLLLFIH
jgi:hypothetical protein